MTSKEGKNSSDRKSKVKDGGDETSTWKRNFAFLCLIVFPSLAWLVAVGGDVLSNIGSVFGSHSRVFYVSGLIIVPISVAYFVKPLRSFAKVFLPVLLSLLLFPTFQVYFCSPLELRNEDLGTQFSLKTTASEFLQQACEQVCLQNSQLSTSLSYSLTLFTPRVSVRTKFDQVLDLNLTTSAMVGGEKMDVAKLVLLKSWRSVKGKYFALHIITRVPVKIKKFQEALKNKKGMTLSGRVENIPADLKNLRNQLEKQRHFVRPFVLEVFRVTPIEE